MAIKDKQRPILIEKIRNFNLISIKKERLEILTPDMTIEDKVSFVITGKLFNDILPATRVLIDHLIEKAMSEGGEFCHEILKKHLEIDTGLQGVI